MVSISKLNKINGVKLSSLNIQKKVIDYDYEARVKTQSDYDDGRWDCEA